MDRNFVRRSQVETAADSIIWTGVGHVSFHTRLRRTIQRGKKNLHLDRSIRRGANGGQNKCASETLVWCDAFTLEGLVVRSIPMENY
jgi:hypothetical protein